MTRCRSYKGQVLPSPPPPQRDAVKAKPWKGRKWQSLLHAPEKEKEKKLFERRRLLTHKRPQWTLRVGWPRTLTARFYALLVRGPTASAVSVVVWVSPAGLQPPLADWLATSSPVLTGPIDDSHDWQTRTDRLRARLQWPVDPSPPQLSAPHCTERCWFRDCWRGGARVGSKHVNIFTSSASSVVRPNGAWQRNSITVLFA